MTDRDREDESRGFRISEWRAVPMDEILERLLARKPRSDAERYHRWIVTEGIKPVDLYVYLKARFGEPNGATMIAKNHDDSANLIHWHFTVSCDGDEIDILCFDFRLEIWQAFGDDDLAPQFLAAIKSDFVNYGKAMSEIRKGLEKWQVFLNPYVRLKEILEAQLHALDALDLENVEDPGMPNAPGNADRFGVAFDTAAEKFSRAAQICLLVRMLAPVWAESLVNLLLFLLARPDIRRDPRLYDSVIRQNIDVRIRGLHVSCVGFASAVLYDEWDACKKFHSMMMGRNDMLHGNVDPRLTGLYEVYFEHKTPLFLEFRDFAFLSYKAGLVGATPEQAVEDYQVVQDLVAHILVCLEPHLWDGVRRMVFARDIGWDAARGIGGILFPDHIVDFWAEPVGSRRDAAQQGVAADEAPPRS